MRNRSDKYFLSEYTALFAKVNKVIIHLMKFPLVSYNCVVWSHMHG